jgi:uncharacterized membrane protein YciS (DUF1049 family)
MFTFCLPLLLFTLPSYCPTKVLKTKPQEKSKKKKKKQGFYTITFVYCLLCRIQVHLGMIALPFFYSQNQLKLFSLLRKRKRINNEINKIKKG